MKLVDILARELKAWPDGAFSITQDYDLDVNQVMRDCVPVINEMDRVWLANPGMLEISVFETVEQADDFATAIVSRAEWQAAVDALKVAEGIADAEAGNLIPLDDVKAKYVEYSPAMHAQRAGRVTRVVAWNGEGLPPVGARCETLDEDTDEWVPVKVLAHTEIRGKTHAVAQDENDMFFGLAHDYRPIKTAEQIAAEERDSHVNAMLCYDALGGSRKGLAEALYDAGYRKRVEK